MSTTNFLVNISQARSTFRTGVQLESAKDYLSDAEILGVITIVFVLTLLGLLENFATIFLILRGEGYLEGASNIFLLSIATANFLLCAISAPMFVYSYCCKWIFEIFIQTSKFLALATVGSLFLSTLDRMASILLSLRYVSIMTVRRSVIIVTTLWLSVIGFGALTAANKLTANKQYHLTRYFLMFFIFLIFLMYIYMYSKSRKHRRRIKKQRIAIAGEKKDKREDFRSLKTVVMLAGTFVLGWLPLTLALMFNDRKNNPNQYYRAFSYTAPLTLISASLHPIIYFFRKDDFSRRFLRMKQRLFPEWFGSISDVFSARLYCPCSGRIKPI